jgi:MFS family permease
LLEFTVFVVFYMLLPTVPLYIIDIGGTPATVGWVIGISGPVAAFGAPIYGLGVDRWSRKGMVVIGLAANVVSVLVMILIKSPLLMLGPALLRRVGSGASGAATRTMVLDVVPGSRRGEAMTNFATSHNIAIAFGPLIGLALYKGPGPATLFVTCAVVMAAASVFLIPVGSSNQAKRAPARSQGAGAAVAAQTSRAGRVLNAIIVPEVAIPATVTLLLSAAYLATTTFVAVLGEERQVDDYTTFFVVYAVVVIAGRLITGRMSDKYGRAVILIPSLLLAVACMVTLAYADSAARFIAAALMLGLGFGTGQPMLQAIAADWSPPEKYGRSMAFMTGAFSFGSAGGTVFVGEVSQRWGFTSAFLGLAVIAGAALVIAVWGFRRHRSE